MSSIRASLLRQSGFIDDEAIVDPNSDEDDPTSDEIDNGLCDLY